MKSSNTTMKPQVHISLLFLNPTIRRSSIASSSMLSSYFSIVTCFHGHSITPNSYDTLRFYGNKGLVTTDEPRYLVIVLLVCLLRCYCSKCFCCYGFILFYDPWLHIFSLLWLQRPTNVQAATRWWRRLRPRSHGLALNRNTHFSHMTDIHLAGPRTDSQDPKVR